MRSAPPVVYPVGRSVWYVRLTIWCACLLGLVICLLAWFMGLAMSGLLLLAGVSAGVLLLVAQIAPREFMPEGELDWDGEAWSFRDRGGMREAVEVCVHWDGGSVMLLRVSTPSASWHLDRHVWLRASSSPMHWHGLRCAVHAAGDI